eukprot:6193474-Pleurochrysis_carterae.AAC.2
MSEVHIAFSMYGRRFHRAAHPVVCALMFKDSRARLTFLRMLFCRGWQFEPNKISLINFSQAGPDRLKGWLQGMSLTAAQPRAFLQANEHGQLALFPAAGQKGRQISSTSARSYWTERLTRMLNSRIEQTFSRPLPLRLTRRADRAPSAWRGRACAPGRLHGCRRWRAARARRRAARHDIGSESS